MAGTGTSLAMVLIVLVAVSYGLPSAHADMDFIAHTCKKTNNTALCVAMLSTDPKSAQVSTEHDLAGIALQIATDTTKKNAREIIYLGNKYRGTPDGPVWDVCIMVHYIAAGKLEIDAGRIFNGGDYATTLKIVSRAKRAGDKCENAFKWAHKVSPVADMDRETTEHCGVAGDLIHLLVTK